MTGRRGFPIFLFLLFLISDGVSYAEIRNVDAAILLSRNIRPYIQSLEGVTSVLNDGCRDCRGMDVTTEVITLEDYNEKSLKALKEKLSHKKYALYIAIGPEALRFTQSGILEDTPVIYTTILDPEHISGPSNHVCGISLNIPAEIQIRTISEAIPAIRRIGLLYDPANNQPFMNQLCDAAQSSHFEFIPLEVSSKKDIPSVLKKNWDRMDAVWMIPDRTVISESIIQYVIKEGILNKTGVIGYNRFFHESGAILSFTIDYEKLGIQAGNLALEVLSGKPCRNPVPEFDFLIHETVLEKIGLKKLRPN